jgi:hypothetical protein
MWYMPYRRVRSAVLVYVYIAVGISLAAIALRFRITGPIHLQDHGLSSLVIPAAACVGGFATVLGLNLAAENDGHLEVAWTKPVSREGYALGVFAVDLIAMAVCIVFTALCLGAVLDVYAGHQAIVLVASPDAGTVNFHAGNTLFKTLAYCGFPVCVYAWITAMSASLKRNRGSVAGLFWPVMFVLAFLPQLPVPPIHTVAVALNLFNPIEIYTTSNHPPEPSAWTFAWGWGVAAVLLAAAVVQWRRLQL